MIEVELPDGSIAEFPDGTARDVMQQALQKRFGGSQVATGEDTVRSFGSGLRSGVEGLVGMVGDAGKMQGDILGWVAGKFGASPETAETIANVGRRLTPMPTAPTTEEIQAVTNPVVGEAYQPKTTTGEYARTLGQFAPGAVAGPGGLARKAAMAAVPALVSETAGQVTKGTAAEPYARGLGALAGGVAAAGVRSGASPRQVAPTTEELRLQGKALYDNAKSAGVLVSPQAMNKIASTAAVKLKDFAFDQDLQPDTATVLKKLFAAKNKELSLPELENIRKMASGVVRSAVKPDDRSAAGIVVESIDDIIDDAASFTARDNEGLNALKSAREVWKRKIKTEMLDEAAEKARNQATGFENGLVIQMRSIANNPKKMRAFSQPEQNLIKAVVRRGPTHGALRALGMLSPNSTFGGLVTGGIGVGSGLLPAAISAGVGAAARAGAGALTRGKVEKLQNAVATGLPPSGPAPVSLDALIRSLLAAKAGENSALTSAPVQ